ncbi:MAG: Mor transcription activator family protein [Filifactoraceae bacterium]
MEDILDNLTKEELNEEQFMLADVIGFENYKKLVRAYGGSSIYIPKRDGFVAILRNQKIIDEFNGCNYRELANRYNVTEMWIRTIVKEKLNEQG